LAEEEGEPVQVGAEGGGVVGGVADEGGEAVGEPPVMAIRKPGRARGQRGGGARPSRPASIRRPATGCSTAAAAAGRDTTALAAKGPRWRSPASTGRKPTPADSAAAAAASSSTGRRNAALVS
jgi:hypothetical protein